MAIVTVGPHRLALPLLIVAEVCRPLAVDAETRRPGDLHRGTATLRGETCLVVPGAELLVGEERDTSVVAGRWLRVAPLPGAPTTPRPWALEVAEVSLARQRPTGSTGPATELLASGVRDRVSAELPELHALLGSSRVLSPDDGEGTP